MSVNSVLPGLLPYYGPLSGNDSQKNAKASARAQDFPEQTAITADPSQVAGAESEDASQDTSAPNAGSTETGQFQSNLEQALRQGRASTASPSTATAENLSGLPSPGIAIYQRVSQYGNSEPATSALLKRWNNIMQSSSSADAAAADFAKALAQNETPGLESGVLDLTA